MTTSDGDTPREPEGTGDGGSTGSEQKKGFGDLTTTEQLLGLGALLVIVVSDLLGSIIAEEYFIGRVMWLVAVAVVAAIYVHRIAGKPMAIPYRQTMIVLGYAGAALGAREFISDIRFDAFDGSSAFYALALYAGAVLMALGAYRMSQTE